MLSRLQPASRAVQVGVFAVAAANLVWSIAGMAANPDFGTGSSLTTEQVLGVDFNGWHALSGFLAFGPGIVLAWSARWCIPYALASAGGVAASGAWGLVDSTPAGIWLFANNEADAVLHFATAAAFVLAVTVPRLQATGRLAT